MTALTIFGDDIERELSLAIGNFDGLHLGHQRVFEAAKLASIEAGNHAGNWGILTFSPHPKQFFAPQLPPFRLMDDALTAEIARALGAKAIYFVKFDAALAALAPEAFLSAVKSEFAPSALAIGQDFTFGKDKAGDEAFLTSWAAANEMDSAVAPIQSMAGEKISSSAIRAALQAGEPRKAAAMLSRPHLIEGVVKQGDQRGRDLGFPTANLYPQAVMLPKFGIYATRVHILTGAHQGTYEGASSLGVRPSFGVNAPNFETHILDFDHDIYGETIRVELIDYLRGEIKFDGLDPLIAQMDQDVRDIREILRAEALKPMNAHA